jgi:hypothetical protein
MIDAASLHCGGMFRALRREPLAERTDGRCIFAHSGHLIAGLQWGTRHALRGHIRAALAY